MATLAQLEKALVNAHNAGDVSAARTIATEIKRMRVAAPVETYDPTEGMSGYEKFMAGAGKAFVDTGRGLGQLTGLVSQQDVDDAKRRDAPLMGTGAGIAGNVTGNLATMIGPSAALGAAGKAAALPSAVNAARAFLMPKTVLGAAGQGAAMGAIQPVASDESRLMNTAFGAGASAALPTAIAATKLGKDIVAPFTKRGSEKVAGRVLERFASDPNSILRGGAELVPGSSPTLAEATQDVGLAQLQRALQNNPDANKAITARLMQNQQARIAALESIAGDPGQREFYDAARRAAAQDMYEKAFQEAPQVTPWIKGEINKLMKRPAFREAWKEATTIAQNEGVKLDRKNVVQVSHYAKLALDDKIAKATGNEQRALIATKDKLLSLMESKDFAPSYREARATFAEMSRPINRMDVGQRLKDKLQPALADFGGQVRSRPSIYAESVRNLDDTAKAATGFRGARADKILSSDEIGTVENIARDLGRLANAQDMGLGRGSPTAQNLITQDLLRQTLGPLGLPQSFAENALAQTFMRPVSFAAKIPENRILGLLGDAAVDPKEAKRLLELARKRGLIDAGNAIPYVSAPGIAGLLGAYLSQ